jgi:hypothetical protein
MLSLYDISQEMPYDPLTRHEAELLASHMKSFKFLCSTVIWYNTLNKVNIASKVLQKKEVYLSAAVEILTNTLEYLKKYCSGDGFSSALIQKKLLPILMLSLHFVKKILFVHDNEKRSSTMRILMNLCRILRPFKVEFFKCILDAKLQSLEVRFLQLQQYYIHLKFLYNISSLRNMSKEHLKKHCVDLQALLTDRQAELILIRLQMMEELDVLSVLVKTKRPTIRSTAVHN